jgi:hypothetical protein
MFITKSKIDKPSTIDFGKISIQTVDKFKLLGVIIDSKLDFSQQLNQQCMSINRKLHAIKSLFYLPFEVKLQFFKTFIMPYIDYCSTLCIYYKSESIKRLCKYYYLCLYKLFKIKLGNKTNLEINKELQKYGLQSFHSRLIYRLLMFTTKIKLYEKPSELFINISQLRQT